MQKICWILLFQWENRVQKKRAEMVPSWHPVNSERLFWVPIRNRIRNKFAEAFLLVENLVGVEIGNM